MKKITGCILVLITAMLFVGCESPEMKNLRSEVEGLTQTVISERATAERFLEMYKELKAERDAGTLSAADFAEKAPEILEEITRATAKYGELSDQLSTVKEKYKDVEAAGGASGGEMALSAFLALLAGGAAAFPKYKYALNLAKEGVETVATLVGAVEENHATSQVKKVMAECQHPLVEAEVTRQKEV